MKRRSRSTTTMAAPTAVGALMFILISLSACSSAPETIPEDLEPIEYFQRAQQLAMEENNHQGAIRYYRTFIQRNPDDIQHVVEAQYEIAFLYYKQGQTEKARQEFDKLLSYYEGGGGNVLPEWPKILADKLMEKMKEDASAAEGENGSGEEQEAGTSSAGGSESSSGSSSSQ